MCLHVSARRVATENMCELLQTAKHRPSLAQSLLTKEDYNRRHLHGVASPLPLPSPFLMFALPPLCMQTALILPRLTKRDSPLAPLVVPSASASSVAPTPAVSSAASTTTAPTAVPSGPFPMAAPAAATVPPPAVPPR